MGKKKLFIVVRCNKNESYHAAKELDKIIKIKRFSWFAKFGSKIKYENFNLRDEKIDYLLTLSLFEKNKFNLYTYKICDIKRDTLPEAGSFPKYYNESTYISKSWSKGSTWFKVEKYLEIQPKAEDLILISTLNNLTNTLNKSMAGHFLCKLSKDLS